MSESNLNSIAILFFAAPIFFLLFQLRGTWKRLTALESAPTFTPIAGKPSDDVGVLRSQLKNSAFRTERIRYIGGQRDGKQEWVETVPKEIEHPHLPDSYWYTETLIETYRLVGPSPNNAHVHLFEHVGTGPLKTST